MGSQLDVTHVTSLLGLRPCQAGVASRTSGKQLQETPFWAFNGAGSSNMSMEWTSLEEGLTYLLDILEPKWNLLQTLESFCHFIWWCGHFQNSFDGGPRLSGKLLKRLGGFGAEMFIDTYFSERQE